jgi:arsenate reductase (thioredoxin)
MKKTSVLFVSTHNGARSQMAEAFLNHFAGDMIVAESAGFIPGKLDPVAVAVMLECGIDISSKIPESVYDKFMNNKFYNYVIQTCTRETIFECPSFPGANPVIRWMLEKSSRPGVTASQEIATMRKNRDEIKSKILESISYYLNPVS